MALSNSDIVAKQLELVRKHLPSLFSGLDSTWKNISTKTEEERFKELVVNAQNLRKRPVRVRKHRVPKLRP